MKKYFKSLSLVVILGLVACSGRSISKAEAIEILESIEAKEKTDEIDSANVWKFQRKTERTAIYYRSGETTVVTTDNWISEVDKNARQSHYKISEKITGGNKYDSFSEYWTYLEDQKFYILTNDNNEKTYFTIDAGEDFDETFESINSLFLALVYYVMPTYSAETVKSTLLKLDGDASTYDVKSETYKTKGDGNITLEVSLVYKTDSNISTSFKFVYDGYRFVSCHSTSHRASKYDDTTDKEDTSMTYGKVKISFPKLADFTLKFPNE